MAIEVDVDLEKVLSARDIASSFLTVFEIEAQNRYRKIDKLTYNNRGLLFPNPNGKDSWDDRELRIKLAKELAIQLCPEGAQANDKWRRIWIWLSSAGSDPELNYRLPFAS